MGTVTKTYSYDTNWNRTASTAPNGSFTIATGSNRLVSTTVQPARSYGYDAMGNVTSAGSWQYTYGDDSRLAQAKSGATVVNYWYDGGGQRIAKQGAALRYYAYGEAGQTIGEYTDTGVVEETVYLGELPVIVLGQGVNYIFADHLGAPRLLEADDGTVTWSWLDTDPYGSGSATSSVSVAEYNHRFPGQIYDAETGLHYNYFRDYDPQTGRYIESDPIGLNAGVNTYTYVRGNPVSHIDPLGLLDEVHHKLVTEAVLKAAGWPRDMRNEMNQLVADVDVLPGSQNADFEHSPLHAMCAPGQSSGDSEARRAALLDQAMKSCSKSDLAKAMHAAQDSAASGHKNCQVWDGHVSWAHLIGDMFPSPSEFANASAASSAILQRFEQKCGCGK